MARLFRWHRQIPSVLYDYRVLRTFWVHLHELLDYVIYNAHSSLTLVASDSFMEPIRELTIMLAANNDLVVVMLCKDETILEQVLVGHDDEIGGIIMEPLNYNL